MSRITDWLLLALAGAVAIVIIALGIRSVWNVTPRSHLGRRFLLALALVMGTLLSWGCKSQEPPPPSTSASRDPMLDTKEWRQLDRAWDETNRLLLQEERDYRAFKRLKEDFKGVAPAIDSLVAAGEVREDVGKQLAVLFSRRFTSLERRITPVMCYATPSRDFEQERIYGDIHERIALLYHFARKGTMSGAAVEKVLEALEQDFQDLDRPSPPTQPIRPSPPVRWAPPGRSLTPEERENIERILARSEELRRKEEELRSQELQAGAVERQELVQIIARLTGVETDEAIIE